MYNIELTNLFYYTSKKHMNIYTIYHISRSSGSSHRYSRGSSHSLHFIMVMARAIDNILLRSWLKPQPTFYEGGGSSHRQHFQKVVARAIDQHFKGLWIDINQFQWVWLCSSHSLHFTKLVARAIAYILLRWWLEPQTNILQGCGLISTSLSGSGCAPRGVIV